MDPTAGDGRRGAASLYRINPSSDRTGKGSGSSVAVMKLRSRAHCNRIALLRRQRSQREMPKRYTPADIDALIEQILVDAHGEDEGMTAFYEEFRGNVPLPQGVRFLLDDVRKGVSWDESRLR
jgi:hypothetical protein